jgi:CheY-like chemotaxis protein
MEPLSPKCNVLMAEDDEDDRFFMKAAFESAVFPGSLHFVENGKELIDYLLGHHKYHDRASFPMPDLILLDLNMPAKNGFEALKEIRSNEKLRHIPVIIVSTSGDQQSIARGYYMGANAFIRKPDKLEALLEVVTSLKKFWFEIAQLPVQNSTQK